ncbi:ABC transporter permease [Hyphomonas sp. WL0036]|nr:ABC transporter permease [Hyphomonas sediminis]MBY9067570.1 ABC transporter permease [Hyphomonas sediminis]
MSATPSATPFGKLERTLAWRYLRARREHGGASLIAVISFIGIFFAVAALIITMSIMSGFRATLLDALLGGEPHIAAAVDGIPQDEAQAIAKIIAETPDVVSVSPYIEQFVLLSANGVRTGGIVRAIPPADLATMPILKDGGQAALAAGFGEGRNGGNIIMIGQYLAANLGLEPGDSVEVVTSQMRSGPIGQTPISKSYVVGDIFRTGSAQLDNVYVFMPMEQAQILFQSKGRYQNLDIRVKDPDMTEIAMQRIAEATGYSLLMRDWKTKNRTYLGALRTERVMVRLLVTIIMMIATLNIIVGVVMLVKNKTRDVAILRTIGLSRGGVMRVFLMVGTVLGSLGALLGMAVGVLFILNIEPIEGLINFVIDGEVFPAEQYGLDHLPAILDWADVISTGAYALFMSMFVSLIPAMWASSQDPVKALRFE